MCGDPKSPGARTGAAAGPDAAGDGPAAADGAGIRDAAHAASRAYESVQRTVVWGSLASAFRRDGLAPPRLAAELEPAARALGLDARPLLDALAAPGAPPDPVESAAGAPDDLRALYRSFGFTGLGSKAPDHLATKCEFLALLALKEACAWRTADDHDARVCRAAAARFLAAHLGTLPRPRGAFLRAATELLEAMAARETARAALRKPAPA